MNVIGGRRSKNGVNENDELILVIKSFGHCLKSAKIFNSTNSLYVDFRTKKKKLKRSQEMAFFHRSWSQDFWVID